MVAKDADSSEIKTQSMFFRVAVRKDNVTVVPTKEHIQNFFYVLIDPLHWHVILFHNNYVTMW